MQVQKCSLVDTEPVERELDNISGQFDLVTLAACSPFLLRKEMANWPKLSLWTVFKSLRLQTTSMTDSCALTCVHNIL